LGHLYLDELARAETKGTKSLGSGESFPGKVSESKATASNEDDAPKQFQLLVKDSDVDKYSNKDFPRNRVN
jgi:hypothetical protein